MGSLRLGGLGVEGSTRRLVHELGEATEGGWACGSLLSQCLLIGVGRFTVPKILLSERGNC